MFVGKSTLPLYSVSLHQGKCWKPENDDTPRESGKASRGFAVLQKLKLVSAAHFVLCATGLVSRLC